MNKFLLTLLGVFMVACYGSAQSFDQVEKKGKFYLAVDEYYLLDNNPRFGQGATTAAALTLGYTLTPHSGLELSGASLGYEWKNNPRYLSLDFKQYSLTKDRVRVLTSIGLSLVQGQTNVGKDYLKPALNLGVSLQYLCTKNSYVGLNFRKMSGNSNPRYGCPYVSLANWWFQPLTQPSLGAFVCQTQCKSRYFFSNYQEF